MKDCWTKNPKYFFSNFCQLKIVESREGCSGVNVLVFNILVRNEELMRARVWTCAKQRRHHIKNGGNGIKTIYAENGSFMTNAQISRWNDFWEETDGFKQATIFDGQERRKVKFKEKYFITLSPIKIKIDLIFLFWSLNCK